MAFLTVQGTMPFIPIFGASMEPTLQSGSLLMIEPIDAYEVEVGDIIVYSVPSMVREYYNYPPLVAHRVVKVITDRGLYFRTAGDNTGEDPFSIRPGDIRGTVGSQIPYLGLPLLFFQSDQGKIFTVTALALLAVFLYTDELSLSGRWVHSGIFAPVIQESRRTSREVTAKIERAEQRINVTEQALEKFALAIAEYAEHLKSHTSAIQGLAEASHELKNSAAEQNRVLVNLVENMAVISSARLAREPEKPEEAVLRAESRTAPEAQKPPSPPGCIRHAPKVVSYRKLHSQN